jgi:hypothetical protein
MTTQSEIALIIKTALNGLVQNRVYRLIFPQPPAAPVWPAIRYTFVSTVPRATWCGDNGEAGAEYRLQIDVVDAESKGFTSFITFCNSVKSSIKAANVDYHLENQLEDFDEETKTLRMILEYSIFTSNTNPI